MKIITIAVAVAVGFVAGNAESRQKVLALLERSRRSPQGKVLEDMVNGKVGPNVTHVFEETRDRLKPPAAFAEADPNGH